jgi:hypothetical protein
MFSVVFPLYGLGIVGFLVAGRAVISIRHLLAMLLFIAVILLFPIVTDFLIWGSFPLTYDNEGVARLRMIPFIPWPTGGYGVF